MVLCTVAMLGRQTSSAVCRQYQTQLTEDACRGVGALKGLRMSVQAPAMTGVSTPRLGVTPGVAHWLRGIGVRQVRLACGLIMFSYIFSHFFNYALGNVSYALMEKMANVSHLVVADSARQ